MAGSSELFTFTLDETGGFDCREFKRSLGGGGGEGSEHKAPSATAPATETAALQHGSLANHSLGLPVEVGVWAGFPKQGRLLARCKVPNAGRR